MLGINPAALKTGAIALGGAAAVGLMAGAIVGLGPDAKAENAGFTTREQRHTLRDALIGAAALGVAGAAVSFLGGHFASLPKITMPAAIIAGLGVGAAGTGAFMLSHSLTN